MEKVSGHFNGRGGFSFFQKNIIFFLTNGEDMGIITKLISAVPRSIDQYGGITQLVEYPVHTRYVICSNQIAATRPVGQAVKTPPFHGGNMGSIPVRVTTCNKSELFRKSKLVRICLLLFIPRLSVQQSKVMMPCSVIFTGFFSNSLYNIAIARKMSKVML